jgi:hypothetical protein
MHQQLESLFDEAENRYLKPEELGVLSQYVDSLPQRLETYRQLRDQELALMQQVADQLQAAMPQESIETLERSIKNALLVLRYCAMAMLLNDTSFVQNRLLNWLSRTVQTYNTQAVDMALYRLLNQRLTQVFNPQQLSLLKPSLALAQSTLLSAAKAEV